VCFTTYLEIHYYILILMFGAFSPFFNFDYFSDKFGRGGRCLAPSLLFLKATGAV
jgi:hypothetical protein